MDRNSVRRAGFPVRLLATGFFAGYSPFAPATAGSLVGLAMTITRGEVAYQFVLLWSFIGIAVEQEPAPNVVLAAWFAAFFMLVFAVYGLMSRQTT